MPDGRLGAVSRRPGVLRTCIGLSLSFIIGIARADTARHMERYTRHRPPRLPLAPFGTRAWGEGAKMPRFVVASAEPALQHKILRGGEIDI